MVLAVPPEKAVRYSPHIREMLGYELTQASFMGYFDGRNPRKLVEKAERET
jgi:hypothetical protein